MKVTEDANFLRGVFDRYASEADFLRVAKGYERRVFADVESKVDFTEY